MIEVSHTPLGRIAVERKAVERLVRDAAEQGDAARIGGSRHPVRLEVGDDRTAVVAVSVSAPRGAVLPDLGRRIQGRIADAVEAVLGVPPARVDVSIEAIHEDGGH